VASGAFAAGSDLLPVPTALRAKSEVYVMAELDDQQAAGLDAMPCINRMIGHPKLSDLYVLPPSATRMGAPTSSSAPTP
jgi:hypothetical protein